MSKDSKGHGSNAKGGASSSKGSSKWGGNFKPTAAGLARMKALEKAMAKPGGRGSTPGYNAGSVDKAINSAARASGGKAPTKKQRSVTHALLKGRS